MSSLYAVVEIESLSTHMFLKVKCQLVNVKSNSPIVLASVVSTVIFKSPIKFNECLHNIP